MGSQLYLTDPNTLLVADTSVVINLNATGCAQAIIGALPCEVAVVDVVQGELGLGKLPQHKDAALLQELIDLSVVKLVVLDESSSAHFESLVVGPAVMTLDDGEAATIAYAAAHQATAILDERKANRICAERYSYLPIACSVDILSHPSVLQHLREQALADAVFNALYYGKMRVLPRHLDWVVTLIGPERAALCISLPHTVRIK